jgi:hypothetical protein
VHKCWIESGMRNRGVRYSVVAYVGLLLAGTLSATPPGEQPGGRAPIIVATTPLLQPGPSAHWRSTSPAGLPGPSDATVPGTSKW